MFLQPTCDNRSVTRQVFVHGNVDRSNVYYGTINIQNVYRMLSYVVASCRCTTCKEAGSDMVEQILIPADKTLLTVPTLYGL